MAALHSYISSILLVVSMTTLSPSNAFLSVGEGFCGVPSGLLCPRCCCCCPQPRPCGCCCPSCPPPPPRCCLCQPPPVMAWAPPSPCTACHNVARRCCPPPPPPQPLWAPPSPFFQQQQFQQQFVPPVHQQLFMGSDFNGVAATPFGVGGQTAAAHLPPPVVMAEAQQQQQQQRIQPIIYVLGGAPFAPSPNETVGRGLSNLQTTGKSSNANGTVPAEIAAEESATESSSSAKTTAEETLSDGEPSNSTTTTAKPSSAAALNLIPKVKLRINPSKRLALKTATEAKREEKSSKLKHFFDEEQSESEAQALYDYEEEKKRGEEDPKTISVNKVAASKLFKMGMGGLFTERDKLLIELLENRKRNSRRKRISNGPTAAVCNSRRMARVMGSAIVEESSIAKRLVKRALQYSFPDSQFDVICAAGGVFSYAIYGKRHCEVQRKGVTCLAFE